MYIGTLSDKYESAGNPAAIGFDPVGSWSYGTNQIATKTGTFGYFLEFLKANQPAIFASLTAAGGNAAATAGTDEFRDAWKNCVTEFGDTFKDCQHQFIVVTQYGTAINRLKLAKLDFSSPPHTTTLADVIYSLSCMAGPGVAKANGSGSCGLIYDAVASLNALDSLGMIDELRLINTIYQQKLKRIDSGREYATQPQNIRMSVRKRVVNEHADAVALLAKERA